MSGFFIGLRQLVVFALKSFIQDFLGSRIEGFRAAILTGADQDHDSTVNVSFVAPLPKGHGFHSFGNAALFADITENRFIFAGHRLSPAVALLHQSAGRFLGGCVSYFTLEEISGRAANALLKLPYQPVGHFEA
jgi:hypothetical protein